jgi:predicted HicB family RNase H-like nuclease
MAKKRKMAKRTQPECERKRKQWMLRVPTEIRELARARARERGMSTSAYVQSLVERDLNLVA